MDAGSSVPVEIETGGGRVRLVVTGCLTERNWRGLLQLLHRIGELVPEQAVCVDLTRAYRVEPRAVEALRRSAAGDTAARSAAAVEFLARPDARDYPGGGTPVRRPVPAATGRRRAAA